MTRDDIAAAHGVTAALADWQLRATAGEDSEPEALGFALRAMAKLIDRRGGYLPVPTYYLNDLADAVEGSKPRRLTDARLRCDIPNDEATP